MRSGAASKSSLKAIIIPIAINSTAADKPTKEITCQIKYLLITFLVVCQDVEHISLTVDSELVFTFVIIFTSIPNY